MSKATPHDLLGPVVAGAFVEAAETEDAVGCVLRMHLICEAYLSNVIDRCASSEMKRFLKSPKYFADKLTVAVALGLPTPFAEVLTLINKMRNKLAHENLATEPIPTAALQDLARSVDALTAVDPNFHPLSRRFLETPVTRPGVQMRFGQGEARVDFLIAVNAFLHCAIKWLDARFTVRCPPQ